MLKSKKRWGLRTKHPVFVLKSEKRWGLRTKLPCFCAEEQEKGEMGFELAAERSGFGPGSGWGTSLEGYLAGRKRMDRVAQRPITIG